MEDQFTNPCNAFFQIFTDQTDTTYKYRQLSPHEFKNNLLKTATKSVGYSKVIDASEGNPNFLATMPRYAYSLLTHVSTALSEEFNEDIGMIPTKKGIYTRFNKLLNYAKALPEGKFLKEAVHKMRLLSGMGKDVFIHNLITSTLGCLYPNPSRILKFVEPILTEFLDKNVYRPIKPFKGKVSIFPTEGASAAIMYIFNSLKYNGLLVDGDKIGILTPIYTPYLEFPSLMNYDLVQVCLQANSADNWEIPDSELEKINDMKALFLVNPTNPSSMSLSSATTRKIAGIVKRNNPDLIIIGDNVYAPFVGEFNSFIDVLPRNTIGIYSFSKYFGTTGWRLGTILLHDNNVIDSKLLKLAPDSVNDRYRMMSSHPQSIKFIDRLLIDSRQVAESHTAGLGTPQQVFMCLCAVYDLIDTGRKYNTTIKILLNNRMDELLCPIDYKVDASDRNSNYYALIDIQTAANGLRGGQTFGDYLYKHRDPLEFLIRLAKSYGVILLPALGFAGPFWGVRVSMANLTTSQYNIIGLSLRDLIDDYYIEFQKWERNQERKNK